MLACMPVGAETPARVHLLIPGAAGGGWDRTARGVGEALQRGDLLTQVTFENMSGGGGGKAIAYVIERADPNILMVNSTPIVVRSLRKIFPQSFRDLTPIASVIGDYSVIAVRADGGAENMAELAASLRAEPRRVPIAGGSVTGGTDHIVAALMFKGLGLPTSHLKYIPYDAGGKAMAGLLSGEVAALSSGYGEVVDLVDQGWVRILCVAAAARLQARPDTPTCAEAGVPGLIFVNWRGFFAAPNLSASRATAYRQLLQEMQSTDAWSEVRDRYGWVDLYRGGDDFTQLMEEQEATLEILMTELGLL